VGSENMHRADIEEAAALANELRQVLIVTAGSDGHPHVASGVGIAVRGEDEIGVTARSCRQTGENVHENPGISLLVWDARRNRGYQILGHVERYEPYSAMGAQIPALRREAPVPEDRTGLLVRVESVLPFAHLHHADPERYPPASQE
jgi:hypothetical protein